MLIWQQQHNQEISTGLHGIVTGRRGLFTSIGLLLERTQSMTILSRSKWLSPRLYISSGCMQWAWHPHCREHVWRRNQPTEWESYISSHCKCQEWYWRWPSRYDWFQTLPCHWTASKADTLLSHLQLECGLPIKVMDWSLKAADQPPNLMFPWLSSLQPWFSSLHLSSAYKNSFQEKHCHQQHKRWWYDCQVWYLTQQTWSFCHHS